PLLVEAYPNCRGPGKGRPWITLVRPVAAAWGLAVSPCLRCLPLSRRFVIFPGRSSIPGGRCSQGGVEIPTGGKGDVAGARERLLLSREEGSADSVRFRSRRLQSGWKRTVCGGLRAFGRWADVVPYALILVLKEES